MKYMVWVSIIGLSAIKFLFPSFGQSRMIDTNSIRGRVFNEFIYIYESVVNLTAFLIFIYPCMLIYKSKRRRRGRL